MDLAAEGPNARNECIDQCLVTAFEPAHDLATGRVAGLRHPTGARPQIGRRQVVETTVELLVQQWSPQALDDPLSTEPAQPVVERRRVEAVLIGRELTTDDE